MSTQFLFLIFALSFVLGAVPFGWIIAKLWGIGDLREKGSHNIGATNVVRTAGWAPGALTFILDFLKGFAPPFLYQYMADSGQDPSLSLWLGVVAVIGHCYSPFLKFRGGKGVSTTLGTVMATNPWLGGASLIVYVVGLAVTRVSAMGSLFAMITVLVGAFVFGSTSVDKLGAAIMVFIVLARHKENWEKLLLSAFLGIGIFFLVGFPPQAFATPVSFGTGAETPFDFRGKQIGFATASKIAALMPSLAENLVDLGAGEKLIAAPEYSRLPGEVSKRVRSLGPYHKISAEYVYSLHPDAVLASMDGNNPILVTELERLGLRVITVSTRSVSEIIRSLKIVATVALGQGDNLKIQDLEKKLTRPKHATTKKVFLQVGWDPIVTINQHTFLNDLIELAGGKNVFGEAGQLYPRPNAEEVIKRNPEVIVVCKLSDNDKTADQSIDFWKRFSKLRAVKTNQIFVIPGDELAKPGFELAKNLEKLERLFGN